MRPSFRISVSRRSRVTGFTSTSFSATSAGFETSMIAMVFEAQNRGVAMLTFHDMGKYREG